MSTRIKYVEDMDKWLILKAALIEHGYKLWQTQYDADSPEGYHARFSIGDKDVEVITHIREIEIDISKSHMY
jgi:hypothetical protein